MIDKDLIRKFSPTGLGVQVSLNHVGCSAGEDRKGRLSLKRVVGGTVAFCHHCGDKGFVRDLNQDGANLRKWLTGKAEDMPRVARAFDMPTSEFVTNPDILKWMHQHHLKLSDTTYFNQSEETGLRMSLYDPTHTLLGYQVRHFKRDAPKYTTHLLPTTIYDTAWFLWPLKQSVLYIVEDYASAYRLYMAGVSAVALLRTSLSGAALTTIQTMSNLKHIYIWLDNDDAGVKGTLKIQQRLNYVLSSSIVISCIGARPEPKWYTPATLVETVSYDVKGCYGF